MKNIALIAGGYSGESVVSVKSAGMVEKQLDTKRFRTFKIVLSREKWSYTDENNNVYEVDKNDFSITIDNEHIRFDAAFIIIHGTPGEDGKLQGYLDMMGVPYTTCDPITSAITFNKAYCNRIVSALNCVNVSPSVHLIKGQKFDINTITEHLVYPCFVKPNAGGSSIGMSKVYDKSELQAAIDRAFKEDDQILIEQFVKGRELTCGVVRLNGEKIALPITEVVSKKDFFDFEAKYTGGMSDEITPAQIPDEIKEKVHKIASFLYDKLNCRGVVRFDFIWKENTSDLFFLEVNTVPGQSEASIVPQQVRAYGMTLEDFYGKMLEDVLL